MQDYKKDIQSTADILIKKAGKRADRPKRHIILNSGVLAVYGLMVSAPILGGLFIGRGLDKLGHPAHFSWAFNLTIIGFVLGFGFAYRWSINQGVIKTEKGKKDV